MSIPFISFEKKGKYELKFIWVDQKERIQIWIFKLVFAHWNTVKYQLLNTKHLKHTWWTIMKCHCCLPWDPRQQISFLQTFHLKKLFFFLNVWKRRRYSEDITKTSSSDKAVCYPAWEKGMMPVPQLLAPAAALDSLESAKIT